MSKRERLRKTNIRQAIGLLVLVLAGIAGWFVYIELGERSRTLVAWFENNGTRTREYRLSVAATDAERQKGLMYVRPHELEPNRGMIFVYPEERTETFWMKDTFSPLDMIFVDQTMKVVGIVHDAAPFTLDRRSVEKPSKYVVELLAGSAKRDGIVEGSKLGVAGLDKVQAR